jgi:hypothetical protein
VTTAQAPPQRVEDHSRSSDPAFDELRSAHEALLRLYGRVLLHVRGLPWWIKHPKAERADAPRSSFGFTAPAVTLRFLVASFTEAHIRGRLQELRDLYLYRRQASASSIEREWLATQGEELAELHGSLPAWARLRSLLRALGPPLTAAALAALGAESLAEVALGSSLEGILVLALIAAGPLAYLTLVCGGAFFHKRALLLGGPGDLVWDEALTSPGANVYQAEDRLWAALGVRKRPEPRIDTLCLAAAEVVFGGICGWLAVGSSGWELFSGLTVVIGCVVLALGTLVTSRRRRWR